MQSDADCSVLRFNAKELGMIVGVLLRLDSLSICSTLCGFLDVLARRGADEFVGVNVEDHCENVRPVLLELRGAHVRMHFPCECGEARTLVAFKVTQQLCGRPCVWRLRCRGTVVVSENGPQRQLGGVGLQKVCKQAAEP